MHVEGLRSLCGCLRDGSHEDDCDPSSLPELALITVGHCQQHQSCSVQTSAFFNLAKLKPPQRQLPIL